MDMDDTIFLHHKILLSAGSPSGPQALGTRPPLVSSVSRSDIEDHTPYWLIKPYSWKNELGLVVVVA